MDSLVPRVSDELADLMDAWSSLIEGEVQPPHGPLKISSNGQVTMPAELLRRMDLSAGDSVYVTTADDIEDASTASASLRISLSATRRELTSLRTTRARQRRSPGTPARETAICGLTSDDLEFVNR